MNKKRSSLNSKQRVFANRYILNGENGKEAAIYAGYKTSSAAATAHRLLNDNKNVIEYIESSREMLYKECTMSLERYAYELIRYINGNITRKHFVKVGNHFEEVEYKPDLKLSFSALLKYGELMGYFKNQNDVDNNFVVFGNDFLDMFPDMSGGSDDST